MSQHFLKVSSSEVDATFPNQSSGLLCTGSGSFYGKGATPCTIAVIMASSIDEVMDGSQVYTQGGAMVF